MASLFPKANRSVSVGETGINAVSRIVNDEWGWIFRRNHDEIDFGIDAYIDRVDDDGNVTGQCLAAQIKTGASYFRQSTNRSIIYYGEKKHLNFYLNSPMPVIIILCDDQTKECVWALFDVEKTEGTATGWKTYVPKANVLSADSKHQIERVLGEAVDYTEELEHHWAINSLVSFSDSIYYVVDYDDIESMRVENVASFFKRIRNNESLLIKMQGRIDLLINGYDEDSRELWEIPKVREWYRMVDPIIREWFYFFSSATARSQLLMYACCMCETRRADPPQHDSQIQVIVNSEQLARIVELNFFRLNTLLDYLGIGEEQNKRISLSVMESLGIA